MYKELKEIFDAASDNFLKKSKELICSGVTERCLCVELRDYLKKEIKKTSKIRPLYKKYFVDNEYNRNCGRIKTTLNSQLKVIRIQCDMLVHSRGKEEHDNLIALEMKMSTGKKKDKDDDRDRLKALTKDKHDKNTWSYDGKTFPKHVCGYDLGVYYEINRRTNKVIIEYYRDGEKFDEKVEEF